MKLEIGKWYINECKDKACVEFMRDWLPDDDPEKCVGFCVTKDGEKIPSSWTLRGSLFGDDTPSCNDLVAEWEGTVDINDIRPIDDVTPAPSTCDSRRCLTCQWWFRFDKSQHLVGDCVWHNGTKNTVGSKLRFKGVLKTQADFGCVEWERDHRDCPDCKYPKHDCRCDQQEHCQVHSPPE